MKKYITTVLFLCVWFNSITHIYPQSSQLPGTFLKFSFYDHYSYPEYNLIEVADIDNDQKKETVILAIDTLIILDDSSNTYLQAFDQFPFYLGIVSMKYGKSSTNLSKFILIGQDFLPTTHWSYYYPHNNSFSFGNFDRPEPYYFCIDHSENIWSTNSVDLEDYYNPGIFISSEIFSDPTLVTLVGQGDSSVSFENASYYGFPTTIYMSSNGQYISTTLIRDSIFTFGNPHGAYHYYSSDHGNTWQGENILRGNRADPLWGQITNRNLALDLEYRSLLSGVSDSLGIMHIALWGIGKTINGIDTIETSAILYWNSRDKNWMAITNPSYEKMIDDNGNSLGQYCPGHALGQSLPTISISEDGQIILIAWSIPEYLGEPGNSSLNIYPGDGGQNSTPVYYTDYLANISYDGGQTWSTENIFPLKNKKNVIETLLSLNKKLDYEASSGKIKADFLYMVDEIPGLSSFGQNSLSNSNALYYDSLVLYTTPVEQEKITVADYYLSQNYPNPFNPSTKIKYSVAVAGIVTLMIYDILGREVSMLVNEEKPAGNYEVSFSAKGGESSLASGVYFYQIKAGSFIQSKKMMFLK